MNSAFILPLMLLLIAALTLRTIHKSWFSPGAFFPLLWFFFTIIPIIFAIEYPTPVFGIWVITAFCISIGVGSLLAVPGNNLWSNSSMLNTHSMTEYSKTVQWGTAVTSFLSLIGIFFLILYTTMKFQLDYSFFSLLALPNQISAERYNELLVYPLFLKFLLYWLSPAALFAGVGFALATTKKQYLLYFSPLFIAVIKGALETTRSTILIALVLWLAGYAGARVAQQDNLKHLFDKKSFLFVSVAGIVFVFLFVSLQWLREAGGNFVVELLMERIKLYFFGYLSAFSLWVSSVHNVDVTLGMTTFAGPFSFIGLIDRDLGFYDSTTIIYGLTSTNVYTALRGIINDFTIIGSLVFGIGIGFGATMAFQKSLQGYIFWLVPLTMFYAFTLYAPLISIFHYNSVIASWVIVFSTFFLIPRPAAE